MADSCLLYYITDRKAFAPDEPTRRRRLLEKIAEAARAGVDYIQLREKDLSTRDLELLAREVVALLKKLRSNNPELKPAFLMNSRTDIALAVDADGVHLRSDDISPAEVTAIWRSTHLQIPAAHTRHAPSIAVSCHTAEEVIRAGTQGATFAVFAPVFEKKDMPDAAPTGLSQLREACQAPIPVLALGGVTPQNARSCLEAGAAGISGIRLFQENNVAATVAKLRAISR